MSGPLIDLKMALNAEIMAQGTQDDQNLSRQVPSAVAAKKKSVANSSTTEWNIASQTGTFQGEHWPSHLPRPPSRKNLVSDDVSVNTNAPSVVVFNANTQEGSSMVRVLSEKGLRVTAVVRVFTSRNTKNLIKLKGVTVKVADLNNREAVLQAATGCQQAFLVTKYWERFESPVEEQMAKVVLSASAEAGIQRLLLATFEDTQELRLRNRKSQLIPTVDGRIFPKFDGMNAIDALGKRVGVQITHMMTSYLDDGSSKKSLILIRGENGKIVSQPHIQDISN
jgi:NmrA-like family